MDKKTRQEHKSKFSWIRGQQNVRASARDSTGQSTDKGHALSLRIEIKIRGQQNVRASARDSTGQSTDKGHTPSVRIEIKIPDSSGIEPGSPDWNIGPLNFKVGIFVSLISLQLDPRLPKSIIHRTLLDARKEKILTFSYQKLYE